MIIGIPRSLFYYKYKVLLETFLNELEINYIVSDISNKKILEDGKILAPSESCINLKLFLGHVKNLENKCNFILIPRVESIKKNEKMCTNFYILPDLARNLFNINIIDFNIDVNKKKTFKNAFIDLGMYLGYSYNNVSNAYKKAVEKDKSIKNSLLLEQTSKINSNNKKILVISHTYNLHDEMIGKPIINLLEKNGYSVIYGDINDNDKDDELSSKIYFSYNKELIHSIEKYKNYVDGIILISTFPCGPDSITNELIMRNIKDIPSINLIIDEAESLTGITTRLESFIDIVNKEASYEE